MAHGVYINMTPAARRITGSFCGRGEREKEREKERQGIRGNLGGEDWSFAGLEHATQRNATQQLGGLTYGKEMHGQSERRWWISQGGEEDLAPEGGKLPDRASS